MKQKLPHLKAIVQMTKEVVQRDESGVYDVSNNDVIGEFPIIYPPFDTVDDLYEPWQENR